jgi:phytanoyl-CoA hydroxylase
MRTSVSADQIASYREDGFLMIRQFLDAGEVAELKQGVLDAIATMGRRKIAGIGANLMEGDAYYDRVFTQRINLWRISEVVKSYMLRPELGKLAADLEGVDGLRVWHDQAFIKEPFANPTALHLDNPYWPFTSHHSLTVWIALEDATPENGCLCFLPGSHKVARFDNVLPRDEFGALLTVYPEMSVEPFVATMKAGDCSFHNGLTAHGAGINMTAGRRIAMSCAYMPEGSRFNGQQNILPDDYFERLKPGDLLDDDIFNPVVYRRQPS